MTAAEDDEVVGIRDDLRPERFTASGEPPMLQVSVRVQVGQEDDTALRRAAPVPFASSQAPFSVSIPSSIGLSSFTRAATFRPQNGTCTASQRAHYFRRNGSETNKANEIGSNS